LIGKFVVVALVVVVAINLHMSKFTKILNCRKDWV